MLGTYCLSSGYYDAYYKRALKVRTKIIEDFEKAFNKVDVILAPTTPTPAFKIGEKSGDPLSMYLSDIYTVSVNLAGLAAISVPAGNIDGLPVGAQFIAPPFTEEKLFAVTSIFENNYDFTRNS
jgi:aspartyl-tRNA(Asn)/glutamyl-tRNA(Gln) amidotransferase subunit A